MDLAGTFFISIYGLAALSGGILAWAENTPSVTMLTPPLAIAALLLNERYHLVRLNAFWSGIIGLPVVFILPLIEIYSGTEEATLLTGAHVISILQSVLLFYRKTAPQYWWVFATSCLQVALAAVLTSSPMFGILILLYMFLALWTLSVFTLLLARLRYGRGDLPAQSERDWQWPELDDGTGQPAGDRPMPVDLTPYSSFRSSFQCDPHETDLSWRFIFGIIGMSSAALMLGLLFFLLTPRLWIGSSNTFRDTALDGLSRNLTGFSEKVQLGDFGRILESSAPVLELTLTDTRTDKPVNLETFLNQIGQDEPRLRGVVLGEYTNGEWVSIKAPNPSYFSQSAPLGGGRRDRYIRQSIRLEAIGSRTLFSLADPDYGNIEDQAGAIRIVQSTRTLQFYSTSGPFQGAIRYNLMVAERKDLAGMPFYDVRRQRLQRLNQEFQGHRFPMLAQSQFDEQTLAPYLKCPASLTLVHEIANRIIRRTQEAATNGDPTQAEIAAAIVTYLRDSGEFQYSLDQSRVDGSLDPIEDFLKNRKAGHCQYFATALALLLRSADIPSRVITGFKGGVPSSDVGRLEVQQRHAHAWVEAYVDENWVTLDATPSSREESVNAIGGRVRWYHRIMTTLSTLWSDYVINLSFNKQQRDLYAPLQSLGQYFTTQLKETSSFWKFVQNHLTTFWRHPEQWFSVRGGLTAFTLMLTMLGLFYLFRTVYRLLKGWILGTTASRKRGIVIEFYERFLRLLKPLGLIPQPHQTQQEFAEHVEKVWTSRNLPLNLKTLPVEIAQAFYRLRFGQEILNQKQEDEIRSNLQQLELHLEHSRTFRK